MDSPDISTSASISKPTEDGLPALEIGRPQNAVEPGDDNPTAVAMTRQQPIELTTSSIGKEMAANSRHNGVRGPKSENSLELVLESFLSQLDMQQQQLKLLQALLSAQKADTSHKDASKQAGSSEKNEVRQEGGFIEQRMASQQDEESKENQITPPEPSNWAELHDCSSNWQRDRFSHWRDIQSEKFLEKCREKKMFWFLDPKRDLKEVLSYLQAQPPFGKMTKQGIELSLNMKAERMLAVHHYKYDERGHMEWCQSNAFLPGLEVGKIVTDYSSWEDHPISGRVFMMIPDDSYKDILRLPIQYVAYILQQLGCQDGHWFCHHSAFIFTYLSGGIGTRFNRVGLLSPTGGTRAMQSFWTIHFRYFTVKSFNRKQVVPALDGINIVRENASLDRGGEHATGYLQEVKMSLALTIQDAFSPRMPCWSIIFLADCLLDPCPDKWAGTVPGEERVPKIYGGKYSGFVVFIQCILLGLENICSDWEAVLSSLDDQMSVTITDLFDEDKSNKLMFDYGEFPRSKLYFRMQQLCRLFTSCIEETLRELQFHDDAFLGWFENYHHRLPMNYNDVHFQEHITKKWKLGVEKQVAQLETLLERFKRKGEEVESLRDGLFNATSVKEAATSVRQNQYIFIFTVATVVYLPLGFVTSLFGMHLFDTTDSGVINARSKFWITIFVLSFATYGISAFWYWGIRSQRYENWRARLSTANGRSATRKSKRVI